MVCFEVVITGFFHTHKKCLSKASRILVKLEPKQTVITKGIMQTVIILHSHFMKTFCSTV